MLRFSSNLSLISEWKENNPPNTFLAQLQATDADSESRGEVYYLLGADAPTIFDLDRSTGVLTVSTSLDREEKETYRFMVRAVDRGMPRKESIATVIINVQDRNDNSPRFINKDFTFFVPENFPGFGEIGVLTVTDADAGENGWVALSILNGSDIFVIDTGRGALRAKTSLDREQQGKYYVWIEAIDGGEPALSCITMVTVLLLDVNDNPPTVLFPQSNQSYMLVLPNTLPGTSITEVYAVDRDTGMNAVIAYSIIKRTDGEPGSFDIDPYTGNITLRKSLSNRGLYSLWVKVRDHGQPELYSTVLVNLFVNETVSNETLIQSLLPRSVDIDHGELPPDKEGRKGEQVPNMCGDYQVLTACIDCYLLGIVSDRCVIGDVHLLQEKKTEKEEVRHWDSFKTQPWNGGQEPNGDFKHLTLQLLVLPQCMFTVCFVHLNIS